MIVTNDDDLAARMRLLRSHGMTTLTWDRHRGHASGYDVVAVGFNYRIDEPRAALATRKLERLDEENARRAELDARYRRAIAAIDGIDAALPPVEGAQCAHHLFTVVAGAGVDREQVRRQLAERGVQTSVHYPPVHRFSIYSDDGWNLPVTDAYGDATLTLPMFAHMTEEQQDLVVESLAAALAAPAVAQS
jgi:dTDP-4-amino-4,6-dideoxygalactose transaminase